MMETNAHTEIITARPTIPQNINCLASFLAPSSSPFQMYFTIPQRKATKAKPTIKATRDLIIPFDEETICPKSLNPKATEGRAVKIKNIYFFINIYLRTLLTVPDIKSAITDAPKSIPAPIIDQKNTLLALVNSAGSPCALINKKPE